MSKYRVKGNCSESKRLKLLGMFSLSYRPCVRDLGVHFNESFKLDKHISSVVGSSFYQLCLLSKVKHFLNATTLEMAVHAFISSR